MLKLKNTNVCGPYKVKGAKQIIFDGKIIVNNKEISISCVFRDKEDYYYYDYQKHTVFRLQGSDATPYIENATLINTKSPVILFFVEVQDNSTNKYHLYSISSSCLELLGSFPYPFSLYGRGYYINDNDYEFLLVSHPSSKYGVLTPEINVVYNQNGINVLPENWLHVRIFYNHLNKRQLFYFDTNKNAFCVFQDEENLFLVEYIDNKIYPFPTAKVAHSDYVIRHTKYVLIDDDVSIQIPVEKYTKTDIVGQVHGTTEYVEIFRYDNGLDKSYMNVSSTIESLPYSSEKYYFFPDDGSKYSFILKYKLQNTGLVTELHSENSYDESINYAVFKDNSSYSEIIKLIERCFTIHNNYIFFGVHLYELFGSFEYVLKNRICDERDNPFTEHSDCKNQAEIEVMCQEYGFSQVQLYWYLRNKYYNVLLKSNGAGSILNLKDYEEEFSSILDKNGFYDLHPVLWKNEFALYKITKNIYADAIYQYKADWLSLQSLDIYIPSIKVAIEYQGIQHFEPISHFGGVEGLENRKKLDEKKRELCKQNGIRLIEWSYNIGVTVNAFKKVFKENNIELRE